MFLNLDNFNNLITLYDMQSIPHLFKTDLDKLPSYIWLLSFFCTNDVYFIKYEKL